MKEFEEYKIDSCDRLKTLIGGRIEGDTYTITYATRYPHSKSGPYNDAIDATFYVNEKPMPDSWSWEGDEYYLDGTPVHGKVAIINEVSENNGTALLNNSATFEITSNIQTSGSTFLPNSESLF